jgi:hypothetical protein
LTKIQIRSVILFLKLKSLRILSLYKKMKKILKKQKISLKKKKLNVAEHPTMIMLIYTRTSLKQSDQFDSTSQLFS